MVLLCLGGHSLLSASLFPPQNKGNPRFNAHTAFACCGTMLPLPLTFNFRGHPPKAAAALQGARGLGRMLSDLHPARTADGRMESGAGGKDVALQEGPTGVRAQGKEPCLFLRACLPFS